VTVLPELFCSDAGVLHLFGKLCALLYQSLLLQSNWYHRVVAYHSACGITGCAVHGHSP
jgi:hypothetical protein